VSEVPRTVGPVGATAIVAGSILGVGILLTPPVVATHVPSVAGFVGLWLLGAVVAVAGGLVYAELATLFPEAGGDVVFVERTYGRIAAILVGSVVFLGGFAGSTAAMAVALGTYQLQTLIGAVSTVDLPGTVVLGVGGDQLTGAGIVLGLTALNLGGARLSATAQTVLTLVPMLGLVVLAAVGLTTGSGDLSPSARPLGDLSSAWLGVYFAYAGWPAVVYVAGEVRDPGRTLPLAVLGGTAVTTFLYGLLCAAFLVVLGFDGLADAGEAGTALSSALLGPNGAVLAAGLVAAALLASVNATLLGGARLMWAMARALDLTPLLPRDANGTPRRLLGLQALVASGLCLLGGFTTLLAWTSTAMLLAGAVTVSTQVVLRWRRPDLPRPFRAPLHPLPAVVYIGSALIALLL
jgi:APA family basic amino acid/polyamine antiporter